MIAVTQGKPGRAGEYLLRAAHPGKSSPSLSLPLLERQELTILDFFGIVGPREEMLRGLTSVAMARPKASRAPVWLIEYRLADLAGVDGEAR